MKVYIVTSGLYSDYHIDAVCDNKETAQRICNLINDFDRPRVREYDTANYQILTDGKSIYDIYISLMTGEVYRSHTYDPLTNATVADTGQMWEYDTEMIMFRVRAEDEESAKKIAYDRFVMWKAEKEGAV